MRSKTEIKQNFGKRSACCQWQLSKAETKSKMCVGLVGELYIFSNSALAGHECPAHGPGAFPMKKLLLMPMGYMVVWISEHVWM
jgi:hypothetical protein